MNDEAEAIIDMYDLLAWRLRNDAKPDFLWSVMFDLHDLWHSICGGDSYRYPWGYLGDELEVMNGDPLVAEDVIRRMKIVLAGGKL
jgi:hypothetical protein